ncbi:predicted protein [Micromonas commoda]|uniref:Uncharacterized protein n=1 Tax=Micromonas commoda (strain RCC299 / NOUM17 / CCMP2709) TaxID=296587 RepID=C1EJK4_MICCC|nr:predicted protein [Micromonas commoda]ACO68202.1 predicted protein [Micromonas commoda]|eukprot:XP_002506944.1 predicted protein [Micromonas commoda]
MSNRGTRAPPGALLELGATFDSFFYILGQLTRSPTKLSSRFLFTPLPSSNRASRGAKR